MNLISELPWYYLFLCIAAAALFTFILYRKEKQKETFSKTVLYTLSALRFVSVLTICLLLMNLLLKREINQTEKPLIIFALDNSASIVAGKDSTQIKTEFLNNITKLSADLSDKYKIQTLLFGTKVEQHDNPDYN